MIQTEHYKKINNEFITYIKSKNYSGSHTNYTTPVKEFLTYMEQIGVIELKKVTAQTMIQYYEYLSTRPKQKTPGTLSIRSINGHLLALAMMFDYLLITGVLKKIVVLPTYGKATSEERQTLTTDETLEVYRNTDTKLEKALLSVAYGCGLRRAELNRLNTKDIQFGTGVLIVRDGKGGKRREVPMSNGVMVDLKDYYVNERSQYIRQRNLFEQSFFVVDSDHRYPNVLADHFKRNDPSLCMEPTPPVPS